jgi:hypothetical protein
MPQLHNQPQHPHNKLRSCTCCTVHYTGWIPWSTCCCHFCCCRVITAAADIGSSSSGILQSYEALLQHCIDTCGCQLVLLMHQTLQEL